MKQVLNPFLIVGTLCATLFLSACEEVDLDDTYVLSGTASGSQEVPPVGSAGSGMLTGTYDADDNLLQYSITWTGLTGPASAIHFHGPAAAGANAGPIHTLTIINNGTAGSAGGNITIADSTETYLLSGRIYYNIHTAANPNGEIRGQVSATNE